MIPKARRVKMLRQHLDQIPEFALPPGFSFRFYQPGDEEVWLRIQTAADDLLADDISHELFVHDFGSDQESIARRQFFLLNEQRQAIGTATAWFNRKFQGASFGRVHWVAIIPEFQGRGLAKPLMTAVCRRLRELGHQRAYLSTSTGRAHAIKLYLRFGFVPLIRNEKEKAVWEQAGLI